MGRHSTTTTPRALRPGIGLRRPHVAELLATRPAVGWLEVHAENYFGGGPAVAELERVRRDYPVSLHGVGLSLGGPDALDEQHLDRLAELSRRIEPALVSEHLSWSSAGGSYLNALLPLPYTAEALNLVAAHVDQVQSALGRRILIENPSSYLAFTDSDMGEAAFLAALAARTGCGILLDVNNVQVSAMNCGFDAGAYLAALPSRAIGEIHLAGHQRVEIDGSTLLVDDHGSRVDAAVWGLYAQAVALHGPVPTLVEWDSNLPGLDVLVDEARKAAAITAIETRLHHADVA
jgi:uncharacterized protein (UPF0276 family)